MKKRIIWVLISSIFYFTLFFLCVLFIFNYTLESKIIISYDKLLNDTLSYSVSINFDGNKNKLFCSIDGKNWKSIDNCEFSLKDGEYKIHIKNDLFYITKKFNIEKKILGSFSSNLDNLDVYYLALNGKKDISFIFNYPDDFNKDIIWNVENEKIVSIKNNTIYGNSVGTTNITVTLKDGNTKAYTIVVTDLITPMKLDNNKQIVPCEKYTDEENEMLDNILKSRVQEAGVGTRGGVVAAIRFLAMEFPYSVPYFYENGRLVDNGYRPHLDGEGRYYHKGLYLSDSKYKTLEKGASSKSGPKMWGCELYSTTTKNYDLNGLDCSGFVSWAMLNGGFDVGDVGAGNYKEFDTDLSDLGKRNEITKEYINSGTYKVGDFIAKNGHAALIIGIDDENIYTAEALPPKVKVYTYSKVSKILTTSNLKYIIEMSNIYPNGEGIYTDMWH